MFEINTEICSNERARNDASNVALALTSPTCLEVEMATLTQARAREYFNYEPETGHLHFKQRPASEFTARAAYAKHLERVGKIKRGRLTQSK